jgi:hypothetical protein
VPPAGVVGCPFDGAGADDDDGADDGGADGDDDWVDGDGCGADDPVDAGGELDAGAAAAVDGPEC